MQLRNTLRSYATNFRKIPRRYVLLGVVVLLALFYAVIFRERTITYSYGVKTCDSQTIFLPKLMRQSEMSSFAITTDDEWRVGGYPLLAKLVCVAPTTTPKVGGVEVARLSLLGGPVAKLSYKVQIPDAPKLNLAVLGAPIPSSRPLLIPLNTPDRTFDYVVKQETNTAPCPRDEKGIRCDVPSLAMKQGAEYELSIERLFKKKAVGVVARKKITTLSPVTITESSVGVNQTVYDKPSVVTVTTDKEIAAAEFELRQTGEQTAEPIAASSKIDGKTVTVSFASELPREKSFELVATRFEAVDGSSPIDTYILPFKTSGGPKVTGVNVGSTGVAQNATINISFDQELSEKQDIAKLVSVKGVAATISKQPSRITVQLNGAARCADFSISIAKELQSKYDIVSNNAWVQSMRTTCYTQSVVGYSQKGRAILAYEFGNGPRTILYVGSIHGNEASTASLMQRWITELEAKARQIPADKRIVVIPRINPDGAASGSRVNARNVDLNRNFATSDWKSDITTVGNKPFPGGGGAEAMSEPETRALAAYASRIRPELTLSYHSIGGLLAANQAGRSLSLAATYSKLSGYRNTTGQTSSTFEYSISGTWDDWLAERLGAASILIELGSHSYHQFERNQAAMWAMVNA